MARAGWGIVAGPPCDGMAILSDCATTKVGIVICTKAPAKQGLETDTIERTIMVEVPNVVTAQDRHRLFGRTQAGWPVDRLMRAAPGLGSIHGKDGSISTI